MSTETIIGIAVILLAVATIINSSIGVLLLRRTDPNRPSSDRWNIETLTVADPDEFVRAANARQRRRDLLDGGL